jgi:hypothetical protein
MSKTTSILLVFASLLVFAGLLSLALVTLGLYQRVGVLEDKPSDGGQKVVVENGGGNQAEVLLTDAMLKQVQHDVAREVEKQMAALPTSVPSATSVPAAAVTSATSQNSTSFIPLDGTSTTTSTGWETLEGTGVWVDVLNDYGEGAVVTWSASLKVAHGNGQAFARIWDDTNKIAVDGSELTTTNNVNYETKVSGNLPLWKGKNLYKVQVKSLNGFQVTYSGGKMRVGY